MQSWADDWETISTDSSLANEKEKVEYLEGKNEKWQSIDRESAKKSEGNYYSNCGEGRMKNYQGDGRRFGGKGVELKKNYGPFECRDFKRGFCGRGSFCRFSHGDDLDGRYSAPVLCRDYQKGRCHRHHCRFMHQ